MSAAGFQRFNFDPEEFIEILYRSILKREPDRLGVVYHLAEMVDKWDDGGSLEALVNSFVDSREARDRNFTSSALEFLGKGALSSKIVSVGDHCLTSYLLKIYSLKSFSAPFDWLFSSPSLVAACLDDDFADFLDKKFYSSANYRDDGSTDGRTVHSLFKARFGIDYVFNHHDLTQENSYAYMSRCVLRFRDVAKSFERKIYVCVYQDGQYSNDDLEILHKSLSDYCRNFVFVAFKVGPLLKNGGSSGAKLLHWDGGFYHYYLPSVVDLGPLRLFNASEELEFFKVIYHIDKNHIFVR